MRVSIRPLEYGKRMVLKKTKRGYPLVRPGWFHWGGKRRGKEGVGNLKGN